jgi:hypothetical protein
VKKSVSRCCVVFVRTCAGALVSSSIVTGGSGLVEMLLVCVMYLASVC